MLGIEFSICTMQSLARRVDPHGEVKLNWQPDRKQGKAKATRNGGAADILLAHPLRRGEQRVGHPLPWLISENQNETWHTRNRNSD